MEQSEYTAYTVYLANIRLGKLECNANWWTSSLANRAILCVDCFIIHVTIIVTACEITHLLCTIINTVLPRLIPLGYYYFHT